MPKRKATEVADELTSLLSALYSHDTTNKIALYEPYPFQREFHNAVGWKTNKPARQKALIAGNQTGKTWCGVYEVAIQLTGRYPSWWQGMRFDRPVKWLCASITNELTRDRLQAGLFGPPGIDAEIGTGTIPKAAIGRIAKKPGIPDAYDRGQVAHVSGGYSEVFFRAYEQGYKKFQSLAFQGGHCDEEPPEDVWGQVLRSLIASQGKGYAMITMTPEEGVTEVVNQFFNDLHPGQALIRATWDDAAHIADHPEHRAQLLESFPARQRDMREKGIPAMGSGLIFPTSDDFLGIEAFDLPPHWPRIAGIDYGTDHPTAVVWLAWDRDNDTVYVYDTYKQSDATMAVHAHAINQRGTWIPIVYPHDVNKRDPQSGEPMANMFQQDYGCNFVAKWTNPPGAGQKEGQGGQGTEAGLWAIDGAMQEGRFKVFRHLRDWFIEKGTYHRKNGQVVRKYDDLMSATRYAYQSRRMADIKPFMIHASAQSAPTGLRNW